MTTLTTTMKSEDLDVQNITGQFFQQPKQEYIWSKVLITSKLQKKKLFRRIIAPVDWVSVLVMLNVVTNAIWLQINRCNQLLSSLEKRRNKKIGQSDTKASRCNESHMQKGGLRNGQEERRSTAGTNKSLVWDSSHTILWRCRLWQQSRRPKKELNEVNFTVRCPCIPVVLLETSIWEQPSIRACTVEAGGLGGSEAGL